MMMMGVVVMLRMIIVVVEGRWMICVDLLGDFHFISLW